jgi:hypothetical protein
MSGFSVAGWEAALLGADPVAGVEELIDALPGSADVSAAELGESPRRLPPAVQHLDSRQRAARCGLPEPGWCGSR